MNRVVDSEESSLGLWEVIFHANLSIFEDLFICCRDEFRDSRVERV